MSRTIIDLVLLDRLQQLHDDEAYHHLMVRAEVPVQVTLTGSSGRVKELVKGRCDWVLSYEDTTNGHTDSILLAVEAKPHRRAPAGISQLLLYMAGVHKARQEKEKRNRSTFGMLSDSTNFHFAFLDHNKKFHVSRLFQWRHDQATIIAYIDNILQDAIASSPHTSSSKVDNSIILSFPRYMSSRWRNGLVEESEVDESDTSSVDSDEAVDIVTRRDGVVVMRSSKHFRP